MSGNVGPDQHETIQNFTTLGEMLTTRGDDGSPVWDWHNMRNSINGMMLAAPINYLWRQQKVFIVGGGPCDDSGGLGSGPQDSKWCDDQNRAWYLYFWNEGGHGASKKNRWGYMDYAPGANQLGSSTYDSLNVTVSPGPSHPSRQMTDEQCRMLFNLPINHILPMGSSMTLAFSRTWL